MFDLFSPKNAWFKNSIWNTIWGKKLNICIWKNLKSVQKVEVKPCIHLFLQNILSQLSWHFRLEPTKSNNIENDKSLTAIIRCYNKKPKAYFFPLRTDINFSRELDSILWPILTHLEFQNIKKENRRYQSCYPRW